MEVRHSAVLYWTVVVPKIMWSTLVKELPSLSIANTKWRNKRAKDRSFALVEVRYYLHLNKLSFWQCWQHKRITL